VPWLRSSIAIANGRNAHLTHATILIYVRLAKPLMHAVRVHVELVSVLTTHSFPSPHTFATGTHQNA